MPTRPNPTGRLALLLAAIAVLALAAWLVLRSGVSEPEEPPAARDGPAGEGANLVGNAPPVAEAPRPDRLDGTRVVHGFVRDMQGAGLAGVRVELFDQWEEPWISRRHAFETMPRRPTPIAATTTQADGSFAFAGARQDDYLVVARPAPPAYPVRAFVDTHVFASGAPVVLVLETGAPLRLRVVDGEGRGRAAYVRALLVDGKVVDGRTRVRYRPLDLGPTDGDGRLLAPAVPIGRLSLDVLAPGYLQRTGLLVDVPSAGEVVLRLEEADGAAVAGRVQDEEGRPIADAWVQIELRGELPRAAYAMRGVATDAGGTFRLEGLPPLRVECLAVEGRGFVTRTDLTGGVALVAGKVLRLDVPLRRECVLEGTVRAADGAPIAGAVVTVVSAPTTGRYRRFSSSFRDKGVTDAAGRYRLEGLPALQGEVEAGIEGWYTVGEDGKPGARFFSLPEAGAVRRVDLVLARGVAVRGRVVDAEGRGVPRVPVKARGPRGRWLERACLTDEEGRFAYAGLMPGRTWSFSAADDEGSAEPVKIPLEPGAPAVEVTLEWRAGAVIAGHVIYEGGMSPFRGRVRCAAKAGQERWFRQARSVAEDGTFRYTGAPPGAYELSVVDCNLERNGEEVVVEVEEGQHVENVVLHARRMGEIAGVVVDAGGRPAASERVVLRTADGHHGSWSESTIEGGFFRFSGVTDLEYVLSLDRVEQSGVVHVGDVDLRLVLPAAETVVVEGTVLAPDGRPVPRASVTIEQRESRTWVHRSTAAVLDGRFREVVERRAERVDLEVMRAQDALGRDLAVLPVVLRDVDPAAGPVEIRLQAGLVVEGRVEGLPPEALRGLYLVARREEDDGAAPSEAGLPFGVEVRPDATFRLAGLLPGTYRIRADGVERAGCTPAGDLLVEAGDRDVVFRYLPAVTVSGKVSDPEGRPVGGARVQYAWTEASGRSDERGGVSRADGTFTIRAVPAGTSGTLGAFPGRDLERPLLPSSVTHVAAGAANVRVDLPRGAFVRGTLTAPSTTLLPDWAQVAAESTGATGARSWTTTVEEGDPRFVLGPLPPGRYVLKVYTGADWSFGAPVTVDAPADDVRLVGTPVAR